MNIRESMEQRELELLSPLCSTQPSFPGTGEAGRGMRCTYCISEGQRQDPSQ